MWRRVSSHLQALVSWRSAVKLDRSVISGEKILRNRALTSLSSSSAPYPFQRTAPLFSHQATSDADTILSKGKKRVEDVIPIATGHEREELEAELEGRNLLEMDYPVGPFGTKEAPAVIKSVYDKRIVGCPGGEGEDEHDVVWFWLEKGKPHECPVCSQYFVLEVVGPGGPPDGHGDDDHH
ncbi:PREDICTED: cytochrome c oxidase subunit 5b-2, mitochondrial-like [Nelumbo nucifera]|uniref:Cytochrome c oxidase subunit 5b-2, mitochondrial-like n=1 Tax=Nelumbo nucifera TaxID=4432 RepID=A0A1U7ZF20_NELNU|nr:PREDICTED: cytochrome c oxidase subunit 5b-2, mitochondrial-like [Nelumbo nucifera]